MTFAPLAETAEFINGVAFKPDDWGDSGMPIIRIQNLTDPTKPYNRTNRQVPDRFHVRRGDLLVSWSASLGVYEWSPEETALLNQHIFRVMPHEDRVDKRYLRHGLDSALADMKHHLHGATMQHVNRGEFLSTKLFLPPLPEQRRIAAILDQADALRGKRRAAIAQLDTLAQSIFLDMFGDPVTNSMHFESSSLDELMARPFQNGAYFPKEAYSAGGVEMVHMSDAFGGLVKRGGLKRVACSAQDIQKYSLTTSDLLVARRSLNYEGAVKPCLIPQSSEPLIFESSLIRLTPDGTKITVPFLYYYLSHARVRQSFVFPLVTQATIAGINQQNLARVPILLPPIALQKEFGSRVEAVVRLRSTLTCSLARLDDLFSSLQSRAFRGELWEEGRKHGG